MRYTELFEHYVNAFDEDSKAKYADQVWDIMQKSYASQGGFHSADDIHDLIHKTGMWKLAVRSGHVYAAMLYKDQQGRKSIASGTDGSLLGKRDYFKMKEEDIRMERAWAEVSGPVERIMQQSGAEPIPNKFAAILTGKHIDEMDDDGYHYTRIISGIPHKKVIYGFAKLDANAAAKLRLQGIELNDLPDNIKVA